ncbi:hypothetical protein BC835DRAFT_1421245 [Cytidiella melzeri]|nr:hypothetical protein BC835DRAFT_1421245 [Cytidiella melzeri]
MAIGKCTNAHTVKAFPNLLNSEVFFVFNIATTGLNLDCTNIIIILDALWSKQENMQLIGCIWRKPQTKQESSKSKGELVPKPHGKKPAAQVKGRAAKKAKATGKGKGKAKAKLPSTPLDNDIPANTNPALSSPLVIAQTLFRPPLAAIYPAPAVSSSSKIKARPGMQVNPLEHMTDTAKPSAADVDPMDIDNTTPSPAPLAPPATLQLHNRAAWKFLIEQISACGLEHPQLVEGMTQILGSHTTTSSGAMTASPTRPGEKRGHFTSPQLQEPGTSTWFNSSLTRSSKDEGAKDPPLKQPKAR